MRLIALNLLLTTHSSGLNNLIRMDKENKLRLRGVSHSD
jgi:hypothetical protein